MSGWVLIHGFAGAPSQWPAPRGEVHAPWLLGHGPCASRAATFDEEVDRLASEIGGVVHLAGYSLGARVALRLLVRHPRRFASATLIGVHPGLEDPAERAARAAADERWAEILEREGIEAFEERWSEQPIFATQADLHPGALAAQRAVRLSHDPRGLARAMRVLGLAAMPPCWGALEEVTMPVHLMAGERDARFRALAERALAALPHARLTIVPGAGHNLLLEARDVVKEALA